jgi:hypothetical protein
MALGLFDLSLRPVSLEVAGELLGDLDARRVALTELPVGGGPGWVVSTVFLVVDHSFGDGPPVLWETAVSCGVCGGFDVVARYASRDAAAAGHEAWVGAVERGFRAGCEHG